MTVGGVVYHVFRPDAVSVLADLRVYADRVATGIATAFDGSVGIETG